ncbi:macrophage migration inhibitory factor-like isoform X2 [Hyperolius riggenbachi]|uniref:macrophage migration inhibitory factor-like isoform X2 n=1 Tax=Hyperolius riggenbachi TaxID=752182 RepID=UPI0035A30E26
MGSQLMRCEQHFAIMIHAEQQLTFGGTSDPCAVCTLQTIAKSQNEKYSKLICEILSKELHINPERVYIHFIDANRANVGWNSTTFATITF